MRVTSWSYNLESKEFLLSLSPLLSLPLRRLVEELVEEFSVKLAYSYCNRRAGAVEILNVWGISNSTGYWMQGTITSFSRLFLWHVSWTRRLMIQTPQFIYSQGMICTWSRNALCSLFSLAYFSPHLFWSTLQLARPMPLVFSRWLLKINSTRSFRLISRPASQTLTTLATGTFLPRGGIEPLGSGS